MAPKIDLYFLRQVLRVSLGITADRYTFNIIFVIYSHWDIAQTDACNTNKIQETQPEVGGVGSSRQRAQFIAAGRWVEQVKKRTKQRRIKTVRYGGEGGGPPNFFFLPFGSLPWIRHCQTPKSLNTLLGYEGSLDKLRLTWMNLVKFSHIHEQLVHRGFTGISLMIRAQFFW